MQVISSVPSPVYCRGNGRPNQTCILEQNAKNSNLRLARRGVQASQNGEDGGELGNLLPSCHGRGRRTLMTGMARMILLCPLPSLAVEEGASEAPLSPGAALVEVPSPAQGNALVERLLERSRANKEKYDRERLNNYYKRNFKEYFEFIEGTVRRKRPEEITEAERGILEWLKTNR